MRCGAAWIDGHAGRESDASRTHVELLPPISGGVGIVGTESGPHSTFSHFKAESGCSERQSSASPRKDFILRLGIGMANLAFSANQSLRF